MALADELTALVARAGRGVLDDATSFGAALDDYLAPEAASRGVLNLLVDAVRQGALARLLRDIEHGADPARAVAASGDQLARDRASSESASSRWAVALLGYAAGAVDRRVLDAQAPPDTAAPPAPPPPPSAAPAAAPEPPRVPPPVAPPPTGPPATAPAWAPYGGGPSSQPAPPGPARRRTGLVVGGVVLALALLGGGITAVVLANGDDDPTARDDTTTTGTTDDRTDDPTDGATSGGPTTGGPTTGGPTDPAEIAELLTGIAADSFPDGGNPPAVTAQSWSVAASNTPDGYPRDLDESEWAGATSWTVRDEQGASRFNITVTHIPDDAEEWFATDCTDWTSSDDAEVECREFETSDGRAGIEYWFRHPSAGIASHQVVLAGDLATGTPQVTVGERLEDPAEDLTLADVKARFVKTEDDLRSIAVNSRLVLPRPTDTPPLPSYDHCISITPLPDDCPAGLT